MWRTTAGRRIALCQTGGSELEFTSTRVETQWIFLRRSTGAGLTDPLRLFAAILQRERGFGPRQGKCPEVPFIFASGTIGEDHAMEALKAGATDYVLKDRTARLGPAIRRALQEAALAQRKHAEERIIHLAYYDQLTGLGNRTLLEERLQHELQEKTRLPLALLYMDLTRFTEINDTLGHLNGDLLLKEMGQRLKDTYPEAITIARTGNDTFAVLLLRTTRTLPGWRQKQSSRPWQRRLSSKG